MTGSATLYNQPILVTERATSLVVSWCHFQNYYETLFRLGVVTIEDSLFEDVSGDGIDFDTASPGSIIRRCTLRHGPLSNVDAVDLGSEASGVTVENCWIHDFPFDKGVSIGESSSNIVVRACVIYDVDIGVAVKDSSDAAIVNNTIVDCRYGLRCYEKTAGQGGGHAAAWNNIVWTAPNAIVLDAQSTLTATYNDVSGESLYPGISNINEAPLFLNGGQHDYRLADASPAITTGTNGTTMGALFPVGSPLMDADGDGMPDVWEQVNGLLSYVNDAGEDLGPGRLDQHQRVLGGHRPGRFRQYSCVSEFARLRMEISCCRLTLYPIVSMPLKLASHSKKVSG